MGKFKVGDRVVPAEENDPCFFDHWMEYWAKPGEARPTAFYVIRSNEYGVTYAASADAKGGPCVGEGDLEAAPLFAVGDRVRLTEDNEGFGDKGDTGSVVVADADEMDCRIHFDRLVAGDYEWYVDWSRLEPAPLRIEAGKFYKTRDGRKVGPILERDGFFEVGGWHYSASGECCYTGKSGKYAKPEHNLIAEWTSAEKAYSSCAAAEVDVQCEEYGGVASKPKFKVGDKVHYQDDKCTGVGIVHSPNGSAPHNGWFVTVEDKDKHCAAFNGATTRIFQESSLRLVAEATSGRFKVGDLVTRNDGFWDKTGYPVTKVEGDGIWLDPKNGDKPVHYTVNDGMVLVPPKSVADIVRKHAIVARHDNGQPLPATRPFVHPDRDAAQREAARLAKTNPGKEFGVYEFVSSIKEEKVYDHEWQRLAAAGERVKACKELRRISGVSLKAAVSAVDYVKETT